MRRPFGNTADSVAVDPATGDYLPGATGTAWTDRVGGAQVYDLQTLDGQPIAGGQIIADQVTALVAFLGPDDGTDELWVDFGYGRILMQATDTDERVAALEPQVAEHATRLSVIENGKGTAGGYASLDTTGKVPAGQLPSFASQADLDVVTANVDSYKTQTPTLETLPPSNVKIDCWASGTTPLVSFPSSFYPILAVAHTNMLFLSCDMVWDYWDQAANDTDYWVTRIVKYAKADPEFALTIATRSTQTVQADGNGAIARKVVWSFDAEPFDPDRSQFAKGDVLGVGFDARGSVGPMQLPMTVSWRWREL